MENPSRPSSSANSFQYIMSKKVSELTQVVHMLFSKNHERELELKKTQEVYLNEINRLKSESQHRLSNLVIKITKEMEEKLEEKDKENKTCQCDKLNDTEHKLECTKQDLSKQELVNTALQLELSAAKTELDQQSKNIDFMKTTLKQTNEQLNESIHIVEYTTQQLKASQESCHDKESKLTELKMKFTALEDKYMRAQNCIDMLKQDLDKSKTINIELRETMSSCDTPSLKTSKSVLKSDPTSQNHESEEMSKLRQEIQWLRMELNNREGNLNKVFSKFQPVFVSPTERSAQRMMMVTPVGNMQHRDRGFTPPTSSRKHRTPRVYHQDSIPFQNNGLRYSQGILEGRGSMRKGEKSKELTSKFRLLYTK